MSGDGNRMSVLQMSERGEGALAAHLLQLARIARRRHGPLKAENLSAFLDDPDCVRYPTRLVFEFGEMGPNQFAQPEIDARDPDGEHRVLYVHPELASRPEDLIYAVSYMVPVIDYGESVVSDETCCQYGAMLLDRSPAEYYRWICSLADSLSLIPTRISGRCTSPCCPEAPSTPSAP
jgi:hypothetical protein